MSLRKAIFIILSLNILITTITVAANSKSVYVVADTGYSGFDTPIIQAYRIQDSNLVYQTHYESHHPAAIGLAIDTYSEFLFVTHENFEPVQGNEIEIVDAKLMQYIDTVFASRANNLAGIAIDQGKKKVHNILKIIDL